MSLDKNVNSSNERNRRQSVTDLSIISSQVLSEISEKFSSENKFSDESLLQLYYLFGSIFEQALELFESEKVTKILEKPEQEYLNGKSEVRWLLQVTDISGDIHMLFPGVNFCNCTAFRKYVLKNQAVTCEHILAAWLASVDSKKLNTQEITSKLFRDLLKF